MGRSKLRLLSLSLILFCSPFLAWAHDHPGLELKWSELSSVITGHGVELVLADGVTVRGKVLEVLPDALVLKVTRSSAESIFPRGRNEIQRGRVVALTLITSNAAKGAAIGAAVGIPGGIANAKLQGAGAGIGTGVFWVGIGGLIGWAIDHRTTIKILPD